MNAAIGVGVASTTKGLSAINHPGCAAAIWRRTIPTEMHDNLAEIEPDNLPNAHYVLRPEDVCNAMKSVCGSEDSSHRDTLDWLAEMSPYSQSVSRTKCLRRI